jgi:hypothetical protein
MLDEKRTFENHNLGLVGAGADQHLFTSGIWRRNDLEMWAGLPLLPAPSPSTAGTGGRATTVVLLMRAFWLRAFVLRLAVFRLRALVLGFSRAGGRLGVLLLGLWFLDRSPADYPRGLLAEQWH